MMRLVSSFGFELLSRSMCGSIQIVDVRVGEMCVVNGVFIWHLFSHWQVFLHREMASLISVY